jgi:lysozyme
MTAITIAADLIKQFEGLRLTLNYCSAGHKTVGYGHVIKPYEQKQLGNRITENQVEQLLEQDIKQAKSVLHTYCNVPLTENQQAALISFIFNCGAGAFQASTLRQKLNRGEYYNAANELLRWVHAKGGIKLQGLVRCRQMEQFLFLSKNIQITAANAAASNIVIRNN